jgi:sugar phosphate isomerase/epimerase
MAVGAISAMLPPLGAGDPGSRLGIDQPVGCWPTAPRLKSYEAAGFTHVQVRMPPRGVLSDRAALRAHAGALREIVGLTGLSLVLHAPDDLLAGTAEHDEQLDGALTYASIAGSDLLVYHGARVSIARPDVRGRLADERAALRRAVRRAEVLGIRLAIENLAPVYPGTEHACHDPRAVADLVRRLDSEHAGICLDLGHAHIAAELAECDLVELVEPLLGNVILFHVHDNFGAGRARGGQRPGGIEPVRLDLHLAPGAGTVPWDRLAPLVRRHPAPLQLEIHPGGRPEPGTLAVVVRELLGLRAAIPQP